MKKFISALMALCMMIGAISALSVLPVFAADDKTAEGEEETVDYKQYYTTAYTTKEEKLATMELKVSKFGFELYYEPYTGEVAVKNVKTGDIMFTNPYDVGGAKASENIKDQLLSQIIIKYSNLEGNELSMFSFKEAAQREQIKVKNIKNGIRVEYIMGKQESRLLVPQMIEKSRFEEMILANISVESKYNKLSAFYVLKDPFDLDLTERAVTEMQKSYPITKTYAVYLFDTKASEREKTQMEQIIKEFCPNYTYEELEYDHNLVEYTSSEKNPVQFRLALEYSLDESGLSVRLPANGIRFDQSTYQLEYIRILPYIGAGSSEFTGYTVIPDGSGTMVRFEDVLKTGTSRMLAASLYGADYAYHKISGANQQIARMPIFGVIEDTVFTVPNETPAEPETDDTAESGEPAESGEETAEPAEDEQTEVTEASEPAEGSDEPGTEAQPTEPTEPAEPVTYKRKTGYVAIIEEGDALASIITDHGGNQIHKYNSVYTEFNPRPKDTYNLASSISVAGDATWTVVSERKYTGSYRIRYIMLTDLDYAAKNGIDASGCFDASYVGMALAYRKQLIDDGTIKPLESDKEQIPLYLETLGVIKVQDKFLSIPVKVKKALTSLEDIKTMTAELGEQGITNLVYKLTGYINGGMENTIPKSIDVEKAAGNDSGMKNFVKYADEKDIEMYLDIDFSYVKNDKLFDGFSKKKDAVRTIDDRYTQKRTYSPTMQYFTSSGLIAVSPSKFDDIFKAAKSDLEKLGIKGVSLGTVGSDLNTDFDEDDPYNREDSKQNVVKALNEIKESGYKVMLDGGNAYAIPYADHVLNVALDSSHFTYASESVPMFGLVYHGYLNFAGNATNMAGDIRYEMLKILENGADPYFILVYENSEMLKEDEKLSDYFSISYENWKEDLISTYKSLNDALNKVSSSPLKNHEFVIGERVPTAEELAKDAEAEKKAAEDAAKQEAESAAEAERKAKLEKHLAEKNGEEVEEPEETDVPEETLPADTETADTAETGDDVTGEAEEPEEPEIPEEDNSYEYTKYTSDNGMIVKVTYENGYAFILNYNVFDVTVKETGNTVIKGHGYLVLDPTGNIVINSGEEG